jgi:2-amino-4-hydroxy-6-hydroxymethyldihydropteridine diphosphokinase
VSPAGAPRRCWISVGSNVDRERSIRGALRDLRAAFGDLVVSPVYETEAVGFEGDAFLNLVVGISTDRPVGEVNRRLRAIEDAHGRQRGPNRFAPRTLDLDLLTYGDLVGRIDDYELPRGEVRDYAFVLGPLAAVAPGERHPVDGRTYAELWAEMRRGGASLRPFSVDLEATDVPG